ncbi:MAG: hypothetical protein CVV27_13135 [Candidatus Melainabacteria bacterium HGW-Melainabacteria-1]|nr:MAG: hypothetical protein CVV27_13135 [Candidatus Melainabacteria bacterium HGW-Melainabacteria-1]
MHLIRFQDLIHQLAAGRIGGNLFADGQQVAFVGLARGACEQARELAALRARRLVLSAAPTPGFVQALLACWMAGALPMVCDAWSARHLNLPGPWNAAGLWQAGNWHQLGQQIGTQTQAESDEALVLFTSGSSGQPKGVIMDGQRILSHLQTVATAMALSEPATTGVILPLHHSFALITQLLLSLCHGGDLHLLPTDWLPGQRLAYLQMHKLQRLAGVPSHFRLLLDDSAVQLPALRHLTVAGAALDQALATQILRICPHAQLWVGYGLTEAGPRVSALPHTDPRFASGSAGLPLPDTQLRIHDGEIQIKSPWLMRGYLDQPQATASTLVKGWLHSGDTGYLADGYLYVTGRRDDVLRIGGEKVAPQAVEQILLSCPGVTAVAVYGEADPVFGQRAVALIQGDVGIKALRHYARAMLPPEMRPRSWYAVSSLPWTPNGKLRRKDLPQWPKRVFTPGF